MINSSTLIHNEILQQPQCWLDTLDIVATHTNELFAFIEDYQRIIFMGAGTSEYIGNALIYTLNQESKKRFDTISTTDFISDSSRFVKRDERVLIVSFARSGNSPESLASIKKVDHRSKHAKHLLITCNENGALARYSAENTYCLQMPTQSNDKSFAMTSSYSCMLIAGYACFHLKAINRIKEECMWAIKEVHMLFEEKARLIEEFVNQKHYERIAILGSLTLKATAQEAALKVLELSAGSTPSLYDSFLGFRHGPVTFTLSSAPCLILLFMHPNQAIRNYEIDMLNEILKFNQNNSLILIGEALEDSQQFEISLSKAKVSEVFYSLPLLVVAQYIGYLNSIKLKINPDMPFTKGECDGNAKIY